MASYIYIIRHLVTLDLEHKYTIWSMGPNPLHSTMQTQYRFIKLL